jgi:hypothetical protein
VGIVDRRACQLEAWHGEAASWLFPACHLIPGVELTAGAGRVRGGNGREVEYVFQAKAPLREPEPGRPGVGVVAGLGFGLLSQVLGRGAAGAFAYIPVTLPLADERLTLHVNLGWAFERDEHEHAGVVHDEAHHALTWAARGDVVLPLTLAGAQRLALIAEVFGENRWRPEYQVGARGVLLPDRLHADVSWGGHTGRGHRSAGWAVGFAWTPPAL